MTATTDSPFWEVQGLAPCPHHDMLRRGRDACTVPVEGQWHSIYIVSTEREAKVALAWIMDHPDSWAYEHYEDFRVAEPTRKIVGMLRQPWDRRTKERKLSAAGSRGRR